MRPARMTHWERILAAMAGEEVDRVPVSLWHHFPELDLDPTMLAAATVRWQRQFDFDLVKFMPAGTYGVEDWGATSAFLGSPIGTRVVTKPGVTSAEAWPCLRKLSPREGRLAQEIEALAQAAVRLNGEVPILQTLFSPLTTAFKLAGDRIFAHLRQHPDLVEAGLAIIAETTLDFARASLHAGAHGVFFSTQCDSFRLMSEAEYRRFGVPYDRIVLDGIANECAFTMLHLHGEDIMFDLMLGYPVNMLNWHDRRSPLDLAHASSRFGGLLAGGIDQHSTLLHGPVDAIKREVRDAIAATEGRRLMIAPGCVVPIATPEAHYRAVLDAIGEASG